MKEVAIINYGAGNLASLINAIENLSFKPVILNKPEKKNILILFYLESEILVSSPKIYSN